MGPTRGGRKQWPRYSVGAGLSEAGTCPHDTTRPLGAWPCPKVTGGLIFGHPVG